MIVQLGTTSDLIQVMLPNSNGIFRLERPKLLLLVKYGRSVGLHRLSFVTSKLT